MKTDKKTGCLTALIALPCIAVLAFYYEFIAPFGPQCGDMMLKSYGRGIWVAIVGANAEREQTKTCALWPGELGYNRTRSSTDYFRQLMSDEMGNATTDRAASLVSDLSPDQLGGHGVRRADSVAAFSRDNNAWIVICVSNSTPSETAFLIARNASLGTTASATSKLFLVKSPINQPRDRFVWITRGGACFDSRPKYATGALLFPATNETYDVMYP